jgi:hypothetical protein
VLAEEHWWVQGLAPRSCSVSVPAMSLNPIMHGSQLRCDRPICLDRGCFSMPCYFLHVPLHVVPRAGRGQSAVASFFLSNHPAAELNQCTTMFRGRAARSLDGNASCTFCMYFAFPGPSVLTLSDKQSHPNLCGAVRSTQKMVYRTCWSQILSCTHAPLLITTCLSDCSSSSCMTSLTLSCSHADPLNRLCLSQARSASTPALHLLLYSAPDIEKPLAHNTQATTRKDPGNKSAPLPYAMYSLGSQTVPARAEAAAV